MDFDEFNLCGDSADNDPQPLEISWRHRKLSGVTLCIQQRSFVTNLYKMLWQYMLPWIETR